MTETKPKRRWFRFSLRTLFVLVNNHNNLARAANTDVS